MKKEVFLDEEKLRFEVLVKECFRFLKRKACMEFGRVRVSGGTDPRDSGIVARYSRDDLRIDIGWKENEGALILTIKFDLDDLARQEGYVYFEPFIEFLTNGETKALVPYVREGMSIKQLESVMNKRAELFKEGLDGVIKALGTKMETFFPQVESATTDTIRQYHKWMKAKP